MGVDMQLQGAVRGALLVTNLAPRPFFWIPRLFLSAPLSPATPTANGGAVVRAGHHWYTPHAAEVPWS